MREHEPEVLVAPDPPVGARRAPVAEREGLFEGAAVLCAVRARGHLPRVANAVERRAHHLAVRNLHVHRAVGLVAVGRDRLRRGGKEEGHDGRVVWGRGRAHRGEPRAQRARQAQPEEEQPPSEGSVEQSASRAHLLRAAAPRVTLPPPSCGFFNHTTGIKKGIWCIYGCLGHASELDINI
jgi:hypothetical protein